VAGTSGIVIGLAQDKGVRAKGKKKFKSLKKKCPGIAGDAFWKGPKKKNFLEKRYQRSA